ncbi:hypothetical protein [Streptomyces sp. NPDC056227]|uniref:hypothetical protein n=1 Tax=Streptomyces sp. NPDC056227 TaxID=3345753 RepID=UPI0035E2D236
MGEPLARPAFENRTGAGTEHRFREGAGRGEPAAGAPPVGPDPHRNPMHTTRPTRPTGSGPGRASVTPAVG